MKRQRIILERNIIFVVFIIFINAVVVFGQREDNINRSRIEGSKLDVIKLPTPGEADLLAVSKIDNQLFIGDRIGIFKIIEIPEKGYNFQSPTNIPLNQEKFPIRQILFLPSEAGYVLKGNSIFTPKKYAWSGYYTKEAVRKLVDPIADFWSMGFSSSNSACVVGVNLRKEKGKDVVDGGLLICNHDFVKNPKDWKTPVLPVAVQNSKISSQLTGIDFVDENGWLVGANGTIWHTKNGGEEWEEQKSNTENPLLSVYAIDSKNVWAVGFGGAILHLSKSNSDDGSDEQNPNQDNNDDNKKNNPDKNKNSKKSKSEQKNFPEKVIEGVKDKLPSVIVTNTTTSTTVVNTKVFEKNKLEWQNLTENPLAGQSLRLWSVKFAENKRNGWIVGDTGTILYTTDGGATWEKIKLVNEQNKPLFPGLPNFYAMYIDDKYCWIVGGQSAIVRMEYK